jgi:hypothetical protein
VERDILHDDYAETDDFADEIDATYLRKHMELVFWRELASRLTEKIMDNKYGATMDGWNDDQYEEHRQPIQTKVETELQANGLKNLFLLGDF